MEKTGETVEKTVGKTVEKTAEKLIGIIKSNPKVTIKELSSLLNITRRGVEEQIKSLKDKGIIRRVGSAKGGYWEILQGSEPINPNDGETVEKTVVETVEKTVEKAGKTVGKTVGKTGKTVEKTAEKLVGIIKVNSKVTIKELSSLLNITRRGVEEQIKSLKDKGIIRRVGPAKGGHWELLQQS